MAKCCCGERCNNSIVIDGYNEKDVDILVEREAVQGRMSPGDCRIMLQLDKKGLLELIDDLQYAVTQLE